MEYIDKVMKNIITKGSSNIRIVFIYNDILFTFNNESKVLDNYISTGDNIKKDMKFKNIILSNFIKIK